MSRVRMSLVLEQAAESLDAHGIHTRAAEVREGAKRLAELIEAASVARRVVHDRAAGGKMLTSPKEALPIALRLDAAIAAVSP